MCFLPSTKPDLHFDNDGICAACNSYRGRKLVDWNQREREFNEIIKRVRATSTSKWDCIVPVSGGKDSTAQVLKVLEIGLRPLCVTSSTCDLSELGRKNLDNIKRLGVDHLEFSPNPIVRAKLNRIGLEQVGDISWPEHVGIFTIPVRAAVQFGVPLIIWGENSQNEYGGPASAADNNVLNRRWLEEFGGLLGLRVSDLTHSYGIRDVDLVPYSYPTDDELTSVGVTGLFLGHYFEWDGFTNYFLAQAHGFKSFGKTVEGSVVDYENLDNHQTGIHDYFKFLKFGFGRATDLVSISIRRGRISRAQGLELIKLHDGKYPWTCLDKPLTEILKKIDLTVDDFDQICDRFTNRSLFLKDKNGDLVRDSTNSLIKVNYENLKE
jgi:N-acetyl sugar amidotransferase